MLTLFTTAKPFKGHDGIIQRNALKSWTLLHPAVEVILFGDDEGAAEVSAELRLRHEPYVGRHESGMKYLHSIFGRAQEIARHEYLCYSNCDIILMDDFWRSFEKVRNWKRKFLLVGYRWDTDVTAPIDFDSLGWAERLREFAHNTGMRQQSVCVDYFAFPRGLYSGMPALVNGRSYWDHWLVWKALDARLAVVDCAPFATVVHQNHNYGYHPAGKLGTHEDPLAMRNLELSGGRSHQRDLSNCTHLISRDGKIRSTWVRRFMNTRAGYMLWKLAVYHTSSIRGRLGLRRETLRKVFSKDRGHVPR